MTIPLTSRTIPETVATGRRTFARSAIAATLSASLGPLLVACRIPLAEQHAATRPTTPGTPAVTPTISSSPPSKMPAGGWQKHVASPVLGGSLGTIFDAALLREGNSYRMWFSWRDRASIALVESGDGIRWDEPRIALTSRPESDWEKSVNRPVVLSAGNSYHMWYTGQAHDKSWIGYATSTNGVEWKRAQSGPVLTADQPWEKTSVMCPHVLWDEEARVFRMWYSGGEQFEPDAIGYATSTDGLNWNKQPEPVFGASGSGHWDGFKVTGSQVVRYGNWHLMFYIGFRDVDHASIGLARSRIGISRWERHPANPLIVPTPGAWDANAVYKPFAIRETDRWLLWYNGRREQVEQIGLAIHDGADLGFGS